MGRRLDSRTVRRMLIGGAFIAALSGCQDAPQLPLYSSLEEAKTFGYEEKQVETTRYEVTYLTRPQRVSRTTLGREAEISTMSQTAEEIAELRVAEIALDAGYPSYRIVDRRTDSEVMVRDYAYFGGGGFSTFHHHHFPYRRGYPYFPSYYGSSAFAQVRATLDVRMLGADEEDGTDAGSVHDRLGSKYRPTKPATSEQTPG